MSHRRPYGRRLGGVGSMRNAMERGDPRKFRAWGLSLFLRGDLGITLNGSNVSAWADQSGSGNNANQGTAANQPGYVTNDVNGRPVLSMHSIAQLNLTSNITVTTSTLFAVANKTSGTGYSGIIVLHAICLFGQLSTAVWGGFEGAADVPSATQLTSTYLVMEEVIRNFNDIDLVTNGSSITSTAGTAFNARGASSIGMNSGVQPLLGNIAEAIVFSSVVTASPRARIRHYMGARYAIAA